MVRDHSVLRRSSADHATVQSQPSDPVQADHATPVSARCPGGGSPHVVVIVVDLRSSGRVSMTMVVMTVLIDDPAEYQIMSDSLRRFRFKR